MLQSLAVALVDVRAGLQRVPSRSASTKSGVGGETATEKDFNFQIVVEAGTYVVFSYSDDPGDNTVGTFTPSVRCMQKRREAQHRDPSLRNTPFPCHGQSNVLADVRVGPGETVANVDIEDYCARDCPARPSGAPK